MHEIPEEILVNVRGDLRVQNERDPRVAIRTGRIGDILQTELVRLLENVVEQAQRIAALPPDIVQLNKRAVHRQMSVMGLREGIRQGTELCTLAIHQPSFQEFITQTGRGEGKLTSALQKRDEKFGDYRTSKKD